MRKILTVAALIGIMGLPCQLSAQQTRYCLECGKSLSACPYKGNHPNCPTCGKAKDKCAYKGKHLPSQPQLVTNDKGEIVATWRCIVEPRFDDASAFSEGLAAVQVGKKYGYIDHTGKMVIEPQYDAAFSFSEGLAAVRVGESNGKWGYIDKTGKLVIEARYTDVNSFSEGLAAVGLGDWENIQYGFIDKTGRMVIKPQFGDVSSFSEGLAAVRTEREDAHIFGFIDKNGTFIIKPQFEFEYLGDFAYFDFRFSEGKVCVPIGDYDTDDGYTRTQYAYINKNGDVVLEPEGEGSNFHEGLASVYEYDIKNNISRYYYINETGRKMITNYLFKWGKDFSEGLAAVCMDNEKWGYIDKTGTIVISSKYDFAYDFHGSFALIGMGERIVEYRYSEPQSMGIVDKKGNTIIKPEFRGILQGEEGNGIFAIEKDGKWGFIKVSPAK